jgi:hypothetical protein
MSNINEVIKPIIPSFVNDKPNYAGAPTISLYQSNTHYSGHYIKYINKFNELIQSDKTLNKIYNLIINSNMKDKQRMILIMGGILVNINLYKYV